MLRVGPPLWVPLLPDTTVVDGERGAGGGLGIFPGVPEIGDKGALGG